MRKSTRLDFWEVWNEWKAESVFVDHKPTKEEIAEIARKEKWDDDWDEYTRLYRLPVYSTTPSTPRKSSKCTYCNGTGKTDKCSDCMGAGVKSDDSYSTFPCPWCNRGKVKEHTCEQCEGTGKKICWRCKKLKSKCVCNKPKTTLKKNSKTGLVELRKGNKVIGIQG